MSDWINLLDIKIDDIYQTSSGVNKTTETPGEPMSSWMFKYQTKAGRVLVRLIDWQTNDDGVIDHDDSPDKDFEFQGSAEKFYEVSDKSSAVAQR